jgi:hypothetical protein
MRVEAAARFDLGALQPWYRIPDAQVDAPCEVCVAFLLGDLSVNNATKA